MLPLLKRAMVLLKCNNTFLKCAYEILSSKCDFKKPMKSFMFVNTRGHIDSFIPTDLQMEYIVKLVKKIIKGMSSNKTESNINVALSAVNGLNQICENFDTSSGVQTDKQTLPQGDEEVIISD